VKVATDHAILLAIDTATTRSVVALGSLDGTTLADETWQAGYRHGETLLPTIERMLSAAGIGRQRIAGIVIGTGPGAFTGLRVGLATAKGLAHGLGVPIVGISTGSALLGAIAVGTTTRADGWALLLPAGPSERLLVRDGHAATIVSAGDEPSLVTGIRLAAIDLADRAPVDAIEVGERHRDGLAAELLRVGAARLRAGDTDDLARLVPEYVTLPRGAGPSSGEVAWSHDPR
jgi:tRNA threonylcarbamoyl adenosine modification protein YeaZ